MEVIIQSNLQTASHLAARHLAAQLRKKPDLVIGIPSGETPVAMFKDLIRMHRDEGLDFSQATIFGLDEFIGLAPTHPASHRVGAQRALLDQINVRPDRIFFPKADSQDVQAACTAYEDAIRDAGGIDVQVLGIGPAGHLGFNEPTSSLASRTRSKTLTPRTRKDFSNQFGDESMVPNYIMTMGLGTLLDTREVMLLAFGAPKADVIGRAIEGPVTSVMPASVLQLHPMVKVFLDEDAASRLQHTSYYRWVFQMKPEWQKF
ncbi:MAG: glucosamine-6-phosphate deaminase [Kiritimatiellae bacterium]|nr:glucosamine-6-phosphate deaminase [Kiritimatiellia bacterium]MCB1102307.1 glucosamine-6-phosphate deaminase [Kiritimatiellia bacterium]